MQKYLRGRACSLLTFAIRGGFDGGVRFYDALKPLQAAGQPGRRQVARPAIRLHHAPADVAGRSSGSPASRPETIRLSVGIEHIDDILADLDQALAAAAVTEERSA